MRFILITPLLCLIAQAADPLAGTWTANLSKSKRDPNHQFQQATLKVEVDGDTVRLNSSGVNMAGTKVSETSELKADGKERGVPNAPPGVMLTVMRRGTDLEMVTKKDGVVIARGTYRVSSDGKTLTAEVSGKDDQDRAYESSIVFDRQ